MIIKLKTTILKLLLMIKDVSDFFEKLVKNRDSKISS